MTDPVMAAIDRAQAHLAAAQAAREREFERWKRHYGAAGNPNAWIPHMDEIARAVTAAVPGELPAEIADDLTSVADAFLVAADAADRERWTDHAARCAAFVSGHGAYLAAAQRRMTETRDAVWLRRAVAIAALACGGRDSRDEQLVFDDLVRAARDAGVDASAEFRRVAALASATRSFGGASQSVQAFLAAYARR